MQHSTTQDTLVGLFVVTGIAALFYMALQVSNLGTYTGRDSYTVYAQFRNSGGLKVRSPVSVAGVRIGRVAAITLDRDSHESLVEMHIEAQYDNIPIDSSASIYTAGLLGEQYVSIEPGGSADYLQNKSRIDIVSSAIVLEQMIGKFMLNKAEGK